MDRAASAGLARVATALGEALGTPVHHVETGGASDGSWCASAGIPTLDGSGRSAPTTTRRTSGSRSGRSRRAAGSWPGW